MPFLQTTDGTELFFNDWGTGPAVVLIHGWPLSSASWEYQARVLAESGYRVISYDRRGFGKSSQPFSGYDYNTMAADLAALLNALNVTGATLVGFSMGGGEVARYLGTYGSSRVSKAVFVSAVTPYLLKTDDNPEGVDKKVFDDIVEGVEKDRSHYLTGFLDKFFGRSIISHPVSAEFLQNTINMAMQGSPKATIDCVRAFSESDFRDDLAKITIPTLFIHGTSDATVPIDVSARRAVKMVPGATLIEYDGEPHGLNATAPDKLNADLLTFLR